MTPIYITTNDHNSKYCLNKQKVKREGVALREKERLVYSLSHLMAHEPISNHF